MKHLTSISNLPAFPIHVDQNGALVEIMVNAAQKRETMKQFSLPYLACTRIGLNDKRVGEAIGEFPMCLHASEDGEGVGKEILLAVGFDESVPEEGGKGENVVEDGKGIGESGEEGVGAGNEEGNEEVVLLEGVMDDARLHLFQVLTFLAGFEEGGDACS